MLEAGSGRRVAPCLELPQRRVHVLEQLDRTDAACSRRAVRRQTGHDEAEGQRSRVRGDDLGARGLGTDAGLRDVPTPQGRERTHATVLLGRDGVHRHGPGRCEPRAAYGGNGTEDGGHTTLHVTGAAAVGDAVVDPQPERVVALPGREVAGRHHVGVTVERECRSARVSTPDADAPDGLVALDLHPGEVRVAGEVCHVDVPQVDVRSEVLHPLGAPALDVELARRAVDGRDRHEVGERADDLVRIDLREHALVVGVRDVRRGGHGSRMPAGTATQRSPAEKGLGGAAPPQTVRLSLLRQQREPVRAERLTDRLPGTRHRGGRGQEGSSLWVRQARRQAPSLVVSLLHDDELHAT